MKEMITNKLKFGMTTAMRKSVVELAKTRNESLSETVRTLIEAGLKAYGRSKENV